MIQLITPNPNIPCKPGWCLMYVRQTYGLPAAYPTATAAWNASTSKHRDRQFPKGMWTPLWFALENEPAGHVALLAPDGSVYSTSDLGSIPHKHLDLSDLMNFYARYDMTLTYLGWTEDVAGFAVMAPGTINLSSTTNPEEYEVITDADVARIARATADILWPSITIQNDQFHTATRNNIIQEVAKKVEDSEYDVKVFTHNVSNENADRVIHENRVEEEMTRVRAEEASK